MASSWVLGAGALLETPSLFLEGSKRRPQGAPGVCTNGTGQGLGLADYLFRPSREGVLYHIWEGVGS